MCPAGDAAAVALWRKTLNEGVAEGRGEEGGSSVGVWSLWWWEKNGWEGGFLGLL
jgi:hypothetical protein